MRHPIEVRQPEALLYILLGAEIILAAKVWAAHSKKAQQPLLSQSVRKGGLQVLNQRNLFNERHYKMCATWLKLFCCRI
jgi:hypothetical protein